jgi:hypothetical protein
LGNLHASHAQKKERVEKGVLKKYKKKKKKKKPERQANRIKLRKSVGANGQWTECEHKRGTHTTAFPW